MQVQPLGLYPNQTSLTAKNNNVIRPNNAKTTADREPIGRTSTLEEGSFRL